MGRKPSRPHLLFGRFGHMPHRRMYHAQVVFPRCGRHHGQAERAFGDVPDQGIDAFRVYPAHETLQRRDAIRVIGRCQQLVGPDVLAVFVLKERLQAGNGFVDGIELYPDPTSRPRLPRIQERVQERRTVAEHRRDARLSRRISFSHSLPVRVIAMTVQHEGIDHELIPHPCAHHRPKAVHYAAIDNAQDIDKVFPRFAHLDTAEVLMARDGVLPGLHVVAVEAYFEISARNHNAAISSGDSQDSETHRVEIPDCSIHACDKRLLV